MAAASPTPFAMNRDSFPRRPQSRNNLLDHASRPTLRRGAPLSSLAASDNVPQLQHWMGDSSDDEIPVPPMVFSAEAKAILGDEASLVEGSVASRKHKTSSNGDSDRVLSSKEGRRTLSSARLARRRVDSPSAQLSGHRVVRLSPVMLASDGVRRAASASITQESPKERKSLDLITPAPRPRSVQALASRSSNGSAEPGVIKQQSWRQVTETNDTGIEPRTVLRDEENAINEAVAHVGSLSITRVRGEDTGVHGSLRVKRAGKVTGRYLSGPARRGIKRRQSDEDQSPMHAEEMGSAGALHVATKGENGVDQHDNGLGLSTSASPRLEFGTDINPQLAHGKPTTKEQPHNSAAGSQERPIAKEEERAKEKVQDASVDNPDLPPLGVRLSQEKLSQPVFKVPPLPPLISRFDQENEPPPTFKQHKWTTGFALSEKPHGISVLADRRSLAKTPNTTSPLRPALAPRSQNTPMRPPPPPPKMTVLETATAPVGSASASQGRKKRNYISVNGKLFTRMDCIGRGGSSKVYRVMAENFKVFALKRVTLEDQDDTAIRGYKGEIDLLKKLENVERVVRLFDWELNHERQTLSVLMEMGESDLNRVLTQRLNVEEPTLDITFTRYFWKEMLECVRAVHTYDIVHSDLKPANFLLLQGKLKLIDFGISNAIQDNTVNVHREQHIGTPNYMSPEALVDSNAANGLPASVGKMMKLGKPSDVWSLGCILYQMVYGKAPFAHIANQMQRIMAIPNPRHIIDFPDHGVGGAPLSSGLLKTLRRCLNRDASQRPTIEELLGPNDPFLNPDPALIGTVPVSQELLGRIQLNIVRHIRDKGLPDDVELATWPARFFASIKAAVEEGRA